MAKLSERLKALIPSDYTTALNVVARDNYALLDRAAAVCALVEAFQAAERALKVAQMAVIERLGDERHAELRLAQREYAATLNLLIQANVKD